MDKCPKVGQDANFGTINEGDYLTAVLQSIEVSIRATSSPSSGFADTSSLDPSSCKSCAVIMNLLKELSASTHTTSTSTAF